MPTPTIAIYPKRLTLKQGEVTVRPVQAGDEPALLAFFLNLTEEDRFYLKDDVTAPGVLDRWVQDLDYDRVLPLVAVAPDGRIVADASLHRRRGGARRHVGEVRVTVDPTYRGRGLGTAILHEVIDYANAVELEALIFELVSDEQDEGIDAARRAGFSETARLVNHVKDMKGNLHDLVIMRMPLGKWYTWW